MSFGDPSKYIKGWQSAEDAARDVVAVRTIFPGFNHISRIGGLPTGRITTVHGPTHGSKTAFVLGLIKSFVDAGHFGLYVDAEMTTTRTFHEELLGAPLSERPSFGIEEPISYEAAIDNVDEFLKGVTAARKEHPELCSIIVIDSINKLTPKRELEATLKDSSGELSKRHQGRDRASQNQVWLDHLTPLLPAANCAFVIVAQERDKPASNHPVAAHKAVYIKGGDCLEFDASMLIRVSIAAAIKPTITSKDITGYKYRIRLYKNKCGYMDGTYSEANFHMSLPDGEGRRTGFDLCRDMMEYAIELGIITNSGAWFYWGTSDDHRAKFQGKNALATALSVDGGFFDDLVDQINEADVIEIPEDAQED